MGRGGGVVFGKIAQTMLKESKTPGQKNLHVFYEQFLTVPQIVAFLLCIQKVEMN